MQEPSDERSTAIPKPARNCAPIIVNMAEALRINAASPVTSQKFTEQPTVPIRHSKNAKKPSTAICGTHSTTKPARFRLYVPRCFPKSDSKAWALKAYVLNTHKRANVPERTIPNTLFPRNCCNNNTIQAARAATGEPTIVLSFRIGRFAPKHSPFWKSIMELDTDFSGRPHRHGQI